jgi:hypothetical protein
MKRLILFLSICLPMATGVLPWEDGQVLAQPGPTVDKAAGVKADPMKERAERVQQRRKARISQADRQAAADRAKTKAAHATTAPDKAGKGVAQ